jgi:nucleolysin TIA-1/TIAR
MTTLNGRRVHQSVGSAPACSTKHQIDLAQEIRVNWAYQSNSNNKEDTSNHFHIFVGDLSNEVNDEVLLQAFSAFGSVSEARVMWDMKTGRSRGYGFVAFRERPDAEKALASMDGEWLGSRAIRCNWANQKGQPSISQQQAMAAMGMTPTTPFGHHHFPTHGVQSYDMVVQQTPQWQTTCYVGNLTPYTTQNDLVPLFQNFGYVVETRFQSDRGFAFIKMDTHENAAMAICQLSGYNVNGRPLKCSVSLPFLIYFLTNTQTLLVGQRSSSYRPIRAVFSTNLLGIRFELRVYARWLWNSTISLLPSIRRPARSHDPSR